MTAEYPEEAMLTTEEVSKLLRLAPRTVCLWAECNELPAIKIGRCWRFRESQLHAWLTERARSNKGARLLAGILAVGYLFLVPLRAADVGISAQQAERIISELSQIRSLLSRQDTSPQPLNQPRVGSAPISMKLKESIMLGSSEAPLTIVEFTDYQCPFCNRFHMDTFPMLKKNYIDTGKVRFYSRDLPLSIHQNAAQAAEAGRCAAEQNQFWAMRDRMASNPTKLSMDMLINYAKDLGLDAGAFRSCLEQGKFKEAIQKDVTDANGIGATGTPSFLIGRSTPEGVEGQLLIGALPYATFEEKLNALTK